MGEGGSAPPSRPLADYVLLSDCRGAALLARDGSVDWLCWPRFDSPSTLARLLGPDAGHWRIGAAGGGATTRGYLGHTMVVRTETTTPEGVLVQTDALASGAGERGHELGRGSPHALLRGVECREGTVDVELDLAPRPDYGRQRPRVILHPGGFAFLAGAEASVLSAPQPARAKAGQLADERSANWPTPHRTATSVHLRHRLHAGERLAFALQPAALGAPLPPAWSAETIWERLEDTAAAWRSWSDMHQSYQGPYADLVHLSGRVLQALTYQPSGGIVAAATTSLPEVVGGERNWDYRYVWLRDASLTLQALWVAACPDEAERFFGLIAGSCAAASEQGAEAPVLIAPAGGAPPAEARLAHLSGWRASRPVRVGNGADGQHQLDVYGELLRAGYVVREQLAEVGDDTGTFLAGVADAAAARWPDPDSGIWEIRGERRHYLHSKLLCWAGLDRALALADEGYIAVDAERRASWESAREAVRSAILERGWSEAAGAFAQTLDGDDLDAAALLVPAVGLLPGRDPRVLATIAAVEAGLTDARGLLHRYAIDDGLPGSEGAFLLCTFWLAEALALADEPGRARAALERAASHASDLGLLSEEVDPADGAMIGNFPQAFSHVGLVNAAWAIRAAESRQNPTT